MSQAAGILQESHALLRLNSAHRSLALELDPLLSEVLITWDRDRSLLKNAALGVFSDDKQPWTEKLVRIFQHWRNGAAPSIAALMSHAMAALQLSWEHQNTRAALLCALLAQTSHPYPYHNHHHCREVVVFTWLLLDAHQQASLRDRRAFPPFTPAQMATLLLAAAIHDMDHDGIDNTVDNIHTPFRLEDRAFLRAQPIMQAMNMAPQAQSQIQCLLRCTDVSAPPRSISPRGYLRNVVNFRAINPDQPYQGTLPDVLEGLRNDFWLTRMAAILGDADLCPSSSTTYEYALFMSGQVEMEHLGEIRNPEATLRYFIRQILREQFLSPATERCCNRALAAIISKL